MKKNWAEDHRSKKVSGRMKKVRSTEKTLREVNTRARPGH